jgi:hypothetical protein
VAPGFSPDGDAGVEKQGFAASQQGLTVKNEFDFQSLDIDQNTHWLWDGLRHLRPRVVVVEYNAGRPPDVDWKAP